MIHFLVWETNYTGGEGCKSFLAEYDGGSGGASEAASGVGITGTGLTLKVHWAFPPLLVLMVQPWIGQLGLLRDISPWPMPNLIASTAHFHFLFMEGEDDIAPTPDFSSRH